MKSRRQIQLIAELRMAGASDKEINELLPIASRLQELDNGNVQSARAAYRTTARWLRLAQLVGAGTAGIIIGMYLVASAQAALPTSRLYPLQQVTDTIAVLIHPQYRATIMMKRAQQVQELVTNHAADKPVLATLAEYNRVADKYKSTPHANYAAFEYCKTNLQQAAAAASPTIRQAILANLKTLENT